MTKKLVLIGGGLIVLILVLAAVAGLGSPRAPTGGEPSPSGGAPQAAKPAGSATAPKTPSAPAPAPPSGSARQTPFAGGGRIALAVTDAAADIAAIRSVTLTATEVRVHSPQKGWLTIPDGPKTFDLLALQRGNVLGFLGDGYLETGSYNQLWLFIKDVRVEKVDSSVVTAKLPSGSIRFPAFQMNIAGNETLAVTFDFELDKSLHTASDGTYIFLPVIKVSSHPRAEIEIPDAKTLVIRRSSSPLRTTVGMNENGDVVENFSLHPLTNIELVGSALKLRRYDLSEEGLAIPAARAAEIATAGGYLDSILSITLMELNQQKIWELTGVKSSARATIRIDARNGSVLGR